MQEGTSSQYSRFVFMRRIATSLLLLMAAVFFVCLAFLDTYPWLDVVVAFSEAAMVGALADWFAVTALFRQPLGLPIPHTAIIPKNQSKIGKSLGRFVEQYFISDEVLSESSFDLAGPLARWLSVAENRSFVLVRLKGVVVRMVEGLDDEEISTVISNALISELEKVDGAAVVATLLELLQRDGAHELVLDELLVAGREFFLANQTWVEQKIRDACPWFVPSFVDRKIFEAIVERTEQTILEALSDRSHELRKRMHISAEGFIERLRSDKEFRTTFSRLQTTVLHNQEFLSYLTTVKTGAKNLLLENLKSDDPTLLSPLHRGLDKFSSLIESDKLFREKVNRSLRALLGMFVGNHRSDISDTIARTVDSWDIGTLVERFEEQVGKDLQYIRINGTVVGGIVGVLLFYVKVFFS